MNQGDAFRNMSFIHLISSYFRAIHHNLSLARLFFKRYRNSLGVLYKVYRKRYPIHLILKDGTVHEFDGFWPLYNNLRDLLYDPVESTILINGFKFYGGKENGDNLYSIFTDREYDFLPVKGKHVIDIGANIADTAIYFAQAGAERVIGLEPNKTSYELAKLNVAANHFSDKIEIVHAYVSNESVQSIESSEAPAMLSLRSIVDRYDIKPQILKIDCEGCEYDLIGRTPIELLSRFEYIQIEYHYGYKNLIKKLNETGFETDITPPRFFSPINRVETDIHYDNNVRYNSNMFVGWVRASKD